MVQQHGKGGKIDYEREHENDIPRTKVVRPRARVAMLLGVLILAGGMAGAATPTRPLGHTFAKLTQEKTLNVAYFGGSITEGAGASSGKTCWRALTTQWLQEQYPQAKVNEIYAAIGGTGSNLGAFRCQQDVLSKRPDLVFVEFAVNDGGADEGPAKRAMEGIVRQIWKADPATDIVFVYTTAKNADDTYGKGVTPAAVRYHHDVAAHYCIPEVNIGLELYKVKAASGNPWEAFLKDGVHPNDTGYAQYFKTIREFLEAHRADAAAAPATLGAPLVMGALENGRLVDAWSLAAPGWIKEDKTLAGRYPHRLACATPGTELKYSFNGTAIGLYWLVAPDSGILEWSIDGGAPVRRSSWDKYALKFSRANYAVLSDTLAPGRHELKLKVLGEKDPQSKGAWIRIGALMVNGAE